MDANGRDALALERGENGVFVKADIFDHPVSFLPRRDNFGRDAAGCSYGFTQ